MNPDDAEIYARWMNDPETTGFLGNDSLLIGLPSERKALDRMASEGYNFAVVRTGDDELLGGISLEDVDYVNRKATVGLFVGEPENRGKGYGAEALRLILGYGFRTLGLHNIMLWAHADNVRGLACYRKAGFREFGRRHEAKYKNGRFIDLILMEILASEFGVSDENAEIMR